MGRNNFNIQTCTFNLSFFGLKTIHTELMLTSAKLTPKIAQLAAADIFVRTHRCHRLSQSRHSTEPASVYYNCQPSEDLRLPIQSSAGNGQAIN